MTRRTLPLVALGSLLPAASACTGTDVGNPVIDIDVALHGQPPTSSAAALRATGSAQSVVITSAWVSIDRVRLRSGDCSGDAELEIEGPVAVDLLAAGAPPLLSAIEAPLLDYCRFELRWSPHEGSGGPALLAGNALVIEGRTGDQIPFVITSDRNDELRLDAADGDFPVDDATNALVVGLDAGALLAGLELATADVGDDGVIEVSEAENTDLHEIFEQNVRDAARLYDDDDGDGELDPDESEPDDALAR